LLPEVNAILTEGVTAVTTDMVIPDEVTAGGLAQPALDVIVQLITSPSLTEDVVKTELVASLTAVPFLFH
jgi:hypothetical protein